jgi:hypothetical protein
MKGDVTYNNDFQNWSLDLLDLSITITLDYNSSHTELLLGNESLTVVWILNWSLVRVRVTLRLAIYCQSIRLGDKPHETQDKKFYFPTEHLRL